MTKRVVAMVLTALVSSTWAMAHTEVYKADLTGPNENPPNGSPATGTAWATVDLDLLTLRIQADFSGLMGATTAAHIHCCTTEPGNVGVAVQPPSLTGFPLGVNSGTYDNTFDLTLASTYSPGFVSANGGTVSGAMNALLIGLERDQAYFNIHSTVFRGGEIRGFLHHVPDSQGSLVLLGVSGIALIVRKRLSA